MGGGSDIPDAPDYTEVIGMLKDTYKVSSERAQELWDWGKKAYATNSGVGRKAIKNALDQMYELAGDADKYRAEYGTYQPARAKQLDEAMRLGSEGYQEEQAGKGAADVARNVKSAREAAMQRLEGLGIAQSALSQGDLATRVAEAGMQASAANAGREAARNEGRAALAQAIGTGEGVGNRINPAAAGSLAAGNAASAIGPAIDAGRIASAGAAGAQTGQAMQSALGIGNTQNMGFTNQMDRQKAEEAQTSGWDLLGTGLGLATKFIPGFDEGGAIPEPTQMFQAGGGPVPPEASPSGGAIPDDIPAQINAPSGAQAPAQINAGEFIVPQDVAKWLGEKGLQQIVLKARKEMGSPEEAPAQPEMGPPPMDGAGIPPLPAGVAS